MDRETTRSKQEHQNYTQSYINRLIDRQTVRQTDRLPLVWLFQHFLTRLRYLDTGGNMESRTKNVAWKKQYVSMFGREKLR